MTRPNSEDAMLASKNLQPELAHQAAELIDAPGAEREENWL